jgi:methionyl-tRNA formyltransferase
MNSLQRIVFLGSSEFALPSLQALAESERFRPLAVFTQPDRPAGRNLRPAPTPVKQLALQLALPLYQPEDINAEEAVKSLTDLQPDLLIVIAYGQKLKRAVRSVAPLGAINLHPSLLPELRGAAPVPYALLKGLNSTGLTIFKLVSRMDAGPVFYSKPIFIFPGENATDLLSRLAYIGSLCLVQFLENYAQSPWEPVPQEESKATYSRKLEKEDCRIDWSHSALEISNQVRALAMAPGANTCFRSQQLKILAAEVTDKQSSLPAGSIVNLYKNIGFTVQTGDKKLLVKQVQPCNKKVMAAWAYHLGAHLQPGERMGDEN